MYACQFYMDVLPYMLELLGAGGTRQSQSPIPVPVPDSQSQSHFRWSIHTALRSHTRSPTIGELLSPHSALLLLADRGEKGILIARKKSKNGGFHT